MLDVVRRTAEQVFIPVTVGGGIRSVEDIRATVGAGADKISLNTAAVQKLDLLRAGAEQFGAQCIVLAIDARANPAMPSGYEVFIHGGRTLTGKEVLEWAQYGVALGAGEILLTSMDRDGTQKGYDLALNALVSTAVSVPVIASGGVGTLEHFYEGLTAGGADARSEEHTSELQSHLNLVCRLLLEKKKRDWRFPPAECYEDQSLVNANLQGLHPLTPDDVHERRISCFTLHACTPTRTNS